MSDQENDAKRYADLVKSHGKIPDETVADWKRMVTDESYDFHHRALIYRTATEALARIGRKFDVAEPIVKKGE
jgi:hypothetical protein